MLCPEGAQYTNETVVKEEDESSKKNIKMSVEGTSSLELNSYKHPKSWKKSITNFFRNQLRSTKSNDGDHSSGSKENFDKKDISPEQKWQSLGKVFRRQSFVDHWQKSPNQHGESSSQSKRQAVRKVLSTYFGKSPKTTNEKNEN
ncbi:uncharacterized protein LOC116766440 [Danaus plexippus]|uniref:Uncharacterized protein n=1 Tax=Danaus plexippus plexippus TaxID=278856 RepID=A0A212ETN9_DANPL|nr:uncharacterized protein LOC116766440 [Danaus plexippus]OWR44856.1 hypothetical protein KGM_211904 [Danaus plexippus plexippus]